MGYKLGLMFLVLLGAYLLMSRLPLESVEGGHGVDLFFLLFWVVGGAVTLAVLLVAGRKRDRKV
jgi:hypothetical protein